MGKEKIKEDYMEKICRNMRLDIIDMLEAASSGHPGGSLSAVEVLAVLYHRIMNLSLDEKGNRIDKFILSKGHAAPAIYAALLSKGYITKEDTLELRKINGKLEGHPSIKTNGVDMSTGSLGQGLSVSNGLAIAKKLDKTDGYIYCLMGDGELEEGQVWEAAMTAKQYMLDNVIAFVDYNGLQIDGKLAEVKSPEPIDEKFKAFGFDVYIIDGHDTNEIEKTINLAKENGKYHKKPSCIILKTIKGKGVSFMEGNVSYHGKALTKEECDIARAEIKNIK